MAKTDQADRRQVPGKEGNGAACRVLIADDDNLVRTFLTSLLTDLGAEVVATAENGRDAVRAHGLCNPDLTLLDLQMPVMNGDAALREIIARNPNA